MQIGQQLQRVLFAEDLHQRGDDGTGGARRVRVGHADQAAKARIGQVAPEGRHRRAGFLEHRRVDDEGDGVAIERQVGPAHRGNHVGRQLGQHRRVMRDGQAFLKGHEMRIAGAAEEHVEGRVGGLGA